MRLIDADALVEEIESISITISGEDVFSLTAKASVVDHIRFQPTINAVPVVHGRWEDVPQSDVPAHRCSECGKVRYGSRVFPYCPRCGAKMDAPDPGQ